MPATVGGEVAGPNPPLPYATAKWESEEALKNAENVTSVRPSHTYDDANPPLPGGWTALDDAVSCLTSTR